MLLNIISEIMIKSVFKANKYTENAFLPGSSISTLHLNIISLFHVQ